MTSVLHLLGMPEAASNHAKGVDDLILYVHLLMGALFFGWLAYFIYALLRFKKGTNPKADYVGARSHYSTYLELGVATVEAVLLIGLAVPLWAKAVDNPPRPEEKPVEIQVMAQQFAWAAHFPGTDGKWGRQDTKFADRSNPFGLDTAGDPAAKDDVSVVTEAFLLPVNRPVVALISSMDVIHCFKVPTMRVTQDAIPGLSIPVHFTPNKVGNYTITCAQLCGNGHSTMKGVFKVVSEEDYTQWYAEKSKAGGGGSFE
jgi:cytochrome c oxidase subunit 2